MSDYNIIKRATAIIERICDHPSFASGHERVDFGLGRIGYYITGRDTSYFVLKFGGAEVDFYGGEVTKVQCSLGKDGGYLDLDAWLKKIEDRIPEQPTEQAQPTIEIDGVKYVRSE